MGFFSDLKEDLSQAVNELMPEEERNRKKEATEISVEPEVSAEPEVSLDEMLENIEDYQLPEDVTGYSAGESDNPDPAEVEPEPEAVISEEAADMPEAPGEPELYDAAVSEPEAVLTEEAMDMPEAPGEPELSDALVEAPEAVSESEPVYEQEEWVDTEAAEEVPQSENGEMEQLLDQMLEESPVRPETETKEEITREDNKGAEKKMEMGMDRVASDETAVITTGMVITGDITTEGSIDVIGTVNGNVEALGKLNITGHVNGNSKAAEIYAESAKINGEVISAGAVKIGASSVIIGNITATSAAIAGAVKGDIDVKGPVILDASAIVMGNIKSKSVQINNGAVIEGMCSQCYADVSPTSFFEEYKPEARKTKSK